MLDRARKEESHIFTYDEKSVPLLRFCLAANVLYSPYSVNKYMEIILFQYVFVESFLCAVDVVVVGFDCVYDAKWVELQKECWEIEARYLWFISDEMKRNRLNIFTRNAEHVALTSL